MSLIDGVRSQAHNAWLMRRLLSPRQLLSGLALPYHWYIRRDGTAPFPMFLGWYITYACPMACEFCNVSAVAEWQKPMGEEAENRLIDLLVPRIPTVAIGGGEPLIHPGIADRVARIRARKGRVLIVTTGAPLAGRDAARDLAAAAPGMIAFTVLGDEQTHDREMGKEGAWQRGMDGLSNFLAERDPRRTRVTINAPLDATTGPGMRTIIELGRKLGVDAMRFTWLSFLTESEKREEAHEINYLVVPDESMTRFDAGPILELARTLEQENNGFLSFQPRLNQQEREGWHRPGGGVERRCPSLWHTLFLRPDGVAVPCGHITEAQGRPLDEPFESVWNSERMREIRQAQWRQPFMVCRRCCKI